MRIRPRDLQMSEKLAISLEMSISPRGTVKPATRAKRAAMRVDVAQQGKFLPELRDKLLTFDIELPDGQMLDAFDTLMVQLGDMYKTHRKRFRPDTSESDRLREKIRNMVKSNPDPEASAQARKTVGGDSGIA